MNLKTIRFAAIGECMIELQHQTSDQLAMSFGGDTYNVAVYLARYAHDLHLEVDYVTAIGDDPYSQMMLSAWKKENIHTQFVQILANSMPGLYLIRTDSQGERHFYYYRSQSAAKRLFKTPHIEEISRELSSFNYLYFSGISLAILDTTSREKLFQLLKQARENQCVICFDSNYRPSLWENLSTAQNTIQQAFALSDIILTTWQDEQQLFQDENPESCIGRLHKFGCNEIVLKMGAEGCLLFDGKIQRAIEVKKVVEVLDSTAAGDSFNAGFLAAKIKGLTLEKCVQAGQDLASVVIKHRGAIIPKDAMPGCPT